MTPSEAPTCPHKHSFFFSSDELWTLRCEDCGRIISDANATTFFSYILKRLNDFEDRLSTLEPKPMPSNLIKPPLW